MAASKAANPIEFFRVQVQPILVSQSSSSSSLIFQIRQKYQVFRVQADKNPGLVLDLNALFL